MRTTVIAALIAACASAAATPAAAFEFRDDGYAFETRPGMIIPYLAMSPDIGETVYQLCAWAQGEYYVPDTRPSPQVRDCINRQAAANNMTVREIDVIHPDEWYATCLTPEEYRNIRSLMSRPMPQRERPDGMRDEHEQLEGEIREERRRNDAQDQRLDEHGNRLTVVEEALEGMKVTSEEMGNFFENWWIPLLILVLGGVIIAALRYRPRERTPATTPIQPTSPAPAEPVVSTVRVEHSPIELRFPPNMEVKKKEDAPAPEPAPPASPQPAAAPPANGNAHVSIPAYDEKTGITHSILFLSAGKNADGEELLISPWTNRTIKRAHALAYAQEKYNEKGLPKQ